MKKTSGSFPDKSGPSDRASLMDRVVQGQGLLRQLQEPEKLREAAAAVERAALSQGITAIMAASRHSESVVTAAILLSASLRRVQPSDVRAGAFRNVAVVEIVAVTGDSIRSAVHELRDSGAQKIGVVVLHDLSTPSDSSQLPDRLSHSAVDPSSPIDRFGMPDALATNVA